MGCKVPQNQLGNLKIYTPYNEDNAFSSGVDGRVPRAAPLLHHWLLRLVPFIQAFGGTDCSRHDGPHFGQRDLELVTAQVLVECRAQGFVVLLEKSRQLQELGTTKLQRQSLLVVECLANLGVCLKTW
jgi:hypothetical protein